MPRHDPHKLLRTIQLPSDIERAALKSMSSEAIVRDALYPRALEMGSAAHAALSSHRLAQSALEATNQIDVLSSRAQKHAFSDDLTRAVSGLTAHLERGQTSSALETIAELDALRARAQEIDALDGLTSAAFGLTRQIDQLAAATALPWWQDRLLEPLHWHTDLVSRLDRANIVGRSELERIDALRMSPLDRVLTHTRADEFFALAGLFDPDTASDALPRQKRRSRRTTKAKREKRNRGATNAYAAEKHYRSVFTRQHRLELVLREVIHMRMTHSYGDAWPQDRLPLCDCKRMLRYGPDGQSILDHANVFDYASIMCQSEHFDAIFCKGFESPQILKELLDGIRKHRATSHHARPFTVEDKRDYMLKAKAIEIGLVRIKEAFADQSS